MSSAAGITARLAARAEKEPMTAGAFVESLKAMLAPLDRQAVIKNPAPYKGGLVSLTGLFAGSGGDRVYVNFFNLPPGIGAAGGGAEGENNRMMFTVEGFGDEGKPASKVTVEMTTSALPREFRLRKKSGPPGAIARYLADFLGKVVRDVPPHFTHTKV